MMAGKRDARIGAAAQSRKPARTMLSRRALLFGAGSGALLTGAPAVACARGDLIRIGHLTPRAGLLGPLGDHAVMGVQLAAEEINAAGGVNGRRIELLLADASDPQGACARAARLIACDHAALLIGKAPCTAARVAIERAAKRARVPFVDTGAGAAHAALDVPERFVAVFARRYGKPPQAPAWVDYCALRIAARSIGAEATTGHVGRAEVIAPPRNACVR
ncbi:MAG TPA: ABC transporter substrate-binding protein [Xanthobacteraceae bacterium]|nr:ABC transporter substrate-binding protein [Xanthobacteraceae bacterium]